MKRSASKIRLRLGDCRQSLPRRKALSKRGARGKRDEKALEAFRAGVRARCRVPGFHGLYKCERCATVVTLEQFEAHHKRMRSQGGSHDPKMNGAGLCDGPGTPNCHGRAHDRLVPDWRKWILTRKPAKTGGAA